MQWLVLVRWMGSFKHLELQIFTAVAVRVHARVFSLRQEMFCSMSQILTLGPPWGCSKGE